ncbi:MAG TPA: hypothetical protein VET45_12620 [Candidatus Binatia bacterium]|nr:hypothetical protein [Candidatus Binatia bacterium]
MKRRILLPVSALALLSGCATDAVVKTPPAPATTTSPTPPPAAPAPPKTGATPPAGPLRPEVSAAEEQRLLESTRQSIGDVTRTVDELERRPMKPPQQEALRTAKSFIDQARSALDQRDYQRAANLAGKARALTDDLASATK